jgi:hypothetical protein
MELGASPRPRGCGCWHGLNESISALHGCLHVHRPFSSPSSMVASIPMAFFPGSPKRPSHKRMDSLPQHGFGSDTSFASLLDTNPFLFRVYTPKSRAHDAGTSDPFFLGAKFDDEDEASFSDAEMTMSDTASDFSGSISNISETTYADVIRHLDWRRRSSSPYVSTTFSFAWAIWEASRRYQDGVKHDVHIAIIDARALAGRAITSAELLRKGTTAEYVRLAVCLW